MLGGKGLFDRVDVLRSVRVGNETNTRPPPSTLPTAKTKMIINISDFNETNFTKDEKLLFLVFSVRCTSSNVKILFLFFLFLSFFLVYGITGRKISVALSQKKMKDNLNIKYN